MQTYAYKATDAKGSMTEGSIQATNRGAAMQQLGALGLTPIALVDPSDVQGKKAADFKPKAGSRISNADLERFTRELANLLTAGVPLSKALQIIVRESSRMNSNQQFRAIHDDVVGGMSLADAMARWPRSFSDVYVAMVHAGETGGFLDEVLIQIAELRNREQELVGRVKGALIYPVVLATVASGVMIFLLTFFIPRFTSIFADFGGQLPWLTRQIVALSNGLLQYGLFLLIGILLAIVGVQRAWKTDSGRRIIESLILKLPGVGKVIAQLAMVRFCQMLGTLLGAGVPLVNSLKVARKAIGNQTLSDAVDQSVEQVQTGTSLAMSLKTCPTLFPQSVIEMVSVAEESGRLDKELVRLSETYQKLLDRYLRMLVSLMEPLMLLIMGAIVGTVVIGMLLPVFELQDLVQ
ncbi:MAG: type II secretion system F family protein [Phycisphaeraceae bacterium JB051]